jgi:hypothetical protein
MRILRMVLFLSAGLCALAAVCQGQEVGCSSDDGNRHYCEADTRNGVALARQTSGAACQQGYSWGYDERGIWVDHGCRAYFVLRSANGDMRGKTVPCSSDDGHRRYCPANTHAGVALAKQTSGAACEKGYSWDYDDGGIWVDHGCRAYFTVEFERHDEDRVEQAMVRCSSDDGGRRECRTEMRGYVELVRQRSEAACQQGTSWGYGEGIIWVDHGCRADFVVVLREDHDGGDEHHAQECRRTSGEDRAHKLVEQCLQVSPGTHPPCNAENSCRVITDEIRRSCQLLGRDAPGFCEEYRPER